MLGSLRLRAQPLNEAALDVLLCGPTILKYPQTPAPVANPSEGCPSSGVHVSGQAAMYRKTQRRRSAKSHATRATGSGKAGLRGDVGWAWTWAHAAIEE